MPLKNYNDLTFFEMTCILLIELILGVNMSIRDAEVSKKAKTTIYMSEEDESMLNEVFIKRLRDRNKTDKSALLCEGIRLLFEKEIGKSSNNV